MNNDLKSEQKPFKEDPSENDILDEAQTSVSHAKEAADHDTADFNSESEQKRAESEKRKQEIIDQREAKRQQKLKEIAERQQKIRDERELLRQQKLKETEERQQRILEERAANQTKKEIQGTLSGMKTDLDLQNNTLPSELFDLKEQRLAFIAQQKKERNYVTRLFSLVVLLPLVFYMIFIFFISKPLYSTKAAVSVNSIADNASPAMGGLLGMNASSSQGDLFFVYEYLNSQALMESIDDELQVLDLYKSSALDPLLRIRSYSIVNQNEYQKLSMFIKSGIDIQSNLLHLKVNAPDQESSMKIMTLILELAEQHIDRLYDKLAEERIEVAQQSLQKAEEQMSTAQMELTALQVESGLVSPQETVQRINAKIQTLESEAQSKRSELRTIFNSGVKNNDRIIILNKDIADIEEQISTHTNQLIQPTQGQSMSLNQLMIDFEQRKLELEASREAWRFALASLNDVVKEVSLNKKVFQLVSPPRTEPLASYPNAVKGLFVVFIVTLALFAMVRVFVLKK